MKLHLKPALLFATALLWVLAAMDGPIDRKAMTPVLAQNFADGRDRAIRLN